jgi:hypothetical protein
MCCCMCVVPYPTVIVLILRFKSRIVPSTIDIFIALQYACLRICYESASFANWRLMDYVVIDSSSISSHRCILTWHRTFRFSNTVSRARHEATTPKGDFIQLRIHRSCGPWIVTMRINSSIRNRSVLVRRKQYCLSIAAVNLLYTALRPYTTCSDYRYWQLM